MHLHKLCKPHAYVYTLSTHSHRSTHTGAPGVHTTRNHTPQLLALDKHRDSCAAELVVVCKARTARRGPAGPGTPVADPGVSGPHDEIQYWLSNTKIHAGPSGVHMRARRADTASYYILTITSGRRIKADLFFRRSLAQLVPPWVSNTIARDHLA